VLIGMDAGEDRRAVVDAIVAGGFAVCAECDDAGAVADLVAQHQPDVALLDVRLRGDGMLAARRLTESDHDVAVVLLGDGVTDDMLFAALDAGVAGVLPSAVAPDRMPRILHGVLTGEAALPRTTMTRVLHEFSARARADEPESPADTLSPRQLEVAALLREGRSTSEIADALFISKVTVRSHVLAITRRLGLPNRAALVEYLTQC
jgi:DNA-binding NarL/FixJ family response regulator